MSATEPTPADLAGSTVEQPPLTIDTIRTAVSDQHRRITADLADARKQRDRLHERIRALVAEQAEAARMVRALDPRTTKKGSTT